VPTLHLGEARVQLQELQLVAQAGAAGGGGGARSRRCQFALAKDKNLRGAAGEPGMAPLNHENAAAGSAAVEVGLGLILSRYDAVKTPVDDSASTIIM
jgi:hypothetical protein